MINGKNISYHSACIFVRNISISKAFYIDILEQEVDLDFGKNVILKGGLTLWEINPDHIIPKILTQAGIRDEKVNRFEIYFETDNIDIVLEKLIKTNVKLLHSMHEEPWGQRTVRLFDPDNHLIEIGEKMATFVNRLYNSGMNPLQIAQKTTIPLGVVNGLIENRIHD